MFVSYQVNTFKQLYMDKYTKQLTEVLSASRDVAIRFRSKNVYPEHMLLAIMRQDADFTQKVMDEQSADKEVIKKQLQEIILNVLNKYEEENSVMRDDSNRPPELNPQATSILRLADLEARMSHEKTVDVKHLILAILHDGIDSQAKDVLEKNNVNYDDVLVFSQHYNTGETEGAAVSDGIGLTDDEEEDTAENTNGKNDTMTNEKSEQGKPKAGRKTPVLDNFSTDLTVAATEGKLDPVVGRENEIQRLCEILCRRKKNNPILIGEPGVGKSAIVEGLAQMIADNRVSPVLHNKRLVSLDLASMVAGTKYRGQFEERIKALVKELEQNPDVIVFIDEIHTIIGAGSASGTMDASNMLKPALARGVIQCIGATTIDEYRKSIEKDGALERRFQKIIVNQTTAEETLVILNNIKERYEQHHNVHYSEDALKACVTLTNRYVTERSFPDKAIDALDEVGAKAHLRCSEIPEDITQKEKQIAELKAKKEEAVKNQNFELAASYRDAQLESEAELQKIFNQWKENESTNVKTIEADAVADVVSVMTGIPVQRVSESEGERLKEMSDVLKGAVIAQDKAIDKMVKTIRRNKLGLRDPNRPIGVFMFLGPTGVGKTYLAKKLAEHMFGTKDSLIRIDMSEFTESFNASRLVGAPPGYVGYEEGGQLTERVRRKPYSIVLLDEIEKANSSIFNLLLQVLDEGRLTDGNGKLVDFRNTVIIMTSNAGTRQLKEFGQGIGFNAGGLSANMDDKDKEYARSIIQKSLSKQFAPEFLNRLDEIITFDQLDQQAIRKIIDIELKDVYKRVETLGYQLVVEDEAKDFVAEKGYDVQFGARPLKRAIQNYIEDTVCERILSENLSEDDKIVITRQDVDGSHS